MLSEHLSDGETSVLSIAEALTEDACHFLWSVEGSSVAGYSEVPTPLALADGLQGRLHLGLGSTLVPCVLSFDMRLSQLLLYTVADVVGHALTFVDILTECLFVLTVTGLAGLVDTSQRADDLVIGVLHSTLTHVGHVTVSTGDTTLSVDTHTPEFVVRVLCLEDGGT